MAGTSYRINVRLGVEGASGALNSLNSFDNALNSIGRGITSGVASGSLISSALSSIMSNATEAGAAVFNFSARMEQTKIGFETLMGGAVQANQHLKDLQAFAVSTPFEFEGLAKLSRRLQGAGVEAAKVIPLMKDIGNAASAAGASGEALDGIVLAFSQIIAKGRVSAEEVNQLAERGIPLWKILSEQFGKSKAEVMKLAEQGVISSDMMLGAFQKFSQANYGDAMQKQSQTFLGAWSSIKDIMMQDGAGIMQPVYDAIAEFTVNFSNSLQSQEASAQDVGNKWAFALGESMGKSYKEGWLMSTSRDVGSFLYTGGGVLGGSFRKGIEDAQKPDQLSYGEMRRRLEYPISAIADLRRADDTIKQIASSVDSINPLDKALAAEKAKKESELLNDLIKDLTLQLTFFGDSSEVAKVKQKLFNAEIYRMDSALAQSALSLARELDKLKEFEAFQKKATDLRQEMMRNTATVTFNLAYPNATELQKFDDWVKRNIVNVKGLNAELAKSVELNRAMLQQDQNFKDTEKFQNELNQIDEFRQGLRTTFDSDIRRYSSSTDEFRQSIEAFGETLMTTSGVAIKGFWMDMKTGIFNFPQQFAAQIDTLVTKLNDLKKAGKDGTEEYYSAWNDLEVLLKTLGTIKIGGTTGDIFGDGANLQRVISKLQALKKAASDRQLTQSLETLDKEMNDLGLTVSTAKVEFDKFETWLNSSDLTPQMEKYAAAVNMTAEELRKLILQQKAAQLGMTRPRVVGQQENQSQNPFLDGLFGQNGVQKITSEAEYIKNVYRDLGATAAGVIGTMVQGGAQLLEQWIATGEVTGGAIRQMTASIISGLVAQAGIKAIFEVAEGFAAAARYDFVSASGHFAAAKIYGGVALVAAGTGIALGAALGKSNKDGGGSNANQPDYYTSGNAPTPNLRTTNQNLSTNSETSGLRREISVLSETVGALNDKIGGMSPETVLIRGVKNKAGFISDVVVEEINRNGTKATKMGKALRLG